MPLRSSQFCFSLSLLFLVGVWPVLATPSALHTSGSEILDSANNPVELRGTNIGGWLLNELWITQFQPESLTDDHGVREELTTRFGSSETEALLDIYRDNYFTEADIARLRGLGFNHLRVPFHYRVLEDDANPGVYLQSGWERLDWVVAQCASNEMHCILDLHGAPGGQSHDHTTGHAGQNHLWDTPSNQTRTVNLWSAIANRYRNEPHVLFDLINEPVGAPSALAMRTLFDQIHDAIRTTGANQIIMMQLFTWSWDAWVDPTTQGWTNVVYEFHPYDFDNLNFPAQRRLIDDAVRKFSSLRNSLNVPFHVGEWMTHVDPAIDYAMRQFNEHGFGWSHWNFRNWWHESYWGLDYRTSAWDKPDISTDNLTALQTQIATYTRANYTDNPRLINLMATHAATPISAETRSQSVRCTFGLPSGTDLDKSGRFAVIGGGAATVQSGRARLVPASEDWGRVTIRALARPEADARFDANGATGVRLQFNIESISVNTPGPFHDGVVGLAFTRETIDGNMWADDTAGLTLELEYTDASNQLRLRIFRKEGAMSIGTALTSPIDVTFVPGAPVTLDINASVATLSYGGTQRWTGAHGIDFANWRGGGAASIQAVHSDTGRLSFVEIDDVLFTQGTPAVTADFTNTFDQLSNYVLEALPDHWVVAGQGTAEIQSGTLVCDLVDGSNASLTIGLQHDWLNPQALSVSTTDVAELTLSLHDLTAGTSGGAGSIVLALTPEPISGSARSQSTLPALWVEIDSSGGASPTLDFTVHARAIDGAAPQVLGTVSGVVFTADMEIGIAMSAGEFLLFGSGFADLVAPHGLSVDTAFPGGALPTITLENGSASERLGTVELNWVSARSGNAIPVGVFLSVLESAQHSQRIWKAATEEQAA